MQTKDVLSLLELSEEYIRFLISDCSYLKNAEELNDQLAQHQQEIKDFDETILADDDIVGFLFMC